MFSSDLDAWINLLSKNYPSLIEFGKGSSECGFFIYIFSIVSKG